MDCIVPGCDEPTNPEFVVNPMTLAPSLTISLALSAGFRAATVIISDV